MAGFGLLGGGFAAGDGRCAIDVVSAVAAGRRGSGGNAAAGGGRRRGARSAHVSAVRDAGAGSCGKYERGAVWEGRRGTDGTSAGVAVFGNDTCAGGVEEEFGCWNAGEEF